MADEQHPKPQHPKFPPIETAWAVGTVPADDPRHISNGLAQISASGYEVFQILPYLTPLGQPSYMIVARRAIADAIEPAKVIG